MQCPNCGFKVSDTARNCLHCGTMFNVQPAVNNVPNQPVANNIPNQQVNNMPNQVQQPVVQQPLNNISSQPQTPQLSVNREAEFRKYYDAYFGKSYNKVMSRNFSFCTFIMGWLWLLGYKLFSRALSLFLTLLAYQFVMGIVVFFILLIGIDPRFAIAVYAIGLIVISFKYAKSFYSDRLNQANHDIAIILDKTDNEEERIRLCSQEGKPIYVILVICLIPMIFAGIILAIALFFVIYSKIATAQTRESMSQSTIKMDADSYINAIEGEINSREIKQVNGNELADNHTYYMLIDTEADDKYYYNKYLGYSSDEKKGIVIIEFKNNKKTYSICLDEIKSDGRKYNVSNNGDVVTKDGVTIPDVKITNSNKCDANKIIKKYNASQLVRVK